MKKSDLEILNVIETREGHRYLVSDYRTFTGLTESYDLNYNNINENLNNVNNNLYDIVKVYKDYTCNELLWERKEITNDEKALLRNLPEMYKYIARDSSNELCIYKEKPIKNNDEHWNGNDWTFFTPFNHLFPFIKWEDKEPYSIKELLGE